MTTTDQTPARIMNAAGDLVRQFNHASLDTGDNWEYPSHSYDAVGNLAYLLRMVPQAIEQAVRPVMHTHSHGRVLIDGGGDPDAAVRRLRTALDTAVRTAGLLSEAVDAMHNETSPMGVDLAGVPAQLDATADRGGPDDVQAAVQAVTVKLAQLDDAPRTEASELSRDESACRKCRTPFDPADTRFIGAARHSLTPWCRRCVDQCHSSEIADQRCPVCS